MVTLKIALDRPNRVYFAGDTVRGHIQVVDNDDNDDNKHERLFQGLFVTLQGYSHVHWHTVQGKGQRRDYDGHTTHQASSRTVWGRYVHRTAVLTAAGPCAKYRGDDSVVRIPADSLNAPWILRVCHTEWGRPDHLLGEVLLDTLSSMVEGSSSSVSKNNNDPPTQRLQLQRHGKPEGESTVLISAQRQPNDNDVVLLRIHEAACLRAASSSKPNNVYVQVYRAANDVKPDQALPLPTDLVALPNNNNNHHHHLAFAIPIPLDAPGSAEFDFRRTDTCHVRYNLRADLVHAQGGRTTSTRVWIQVLPRRPVATPALCRPYKLEVVDKGRGSGLLGWRTPQGAVTAKLQLERLVYAPGEPMAFSSSSSFVQNESSQRVPVSLFLRCHVHLRTSVARNAVSHEREYKIAAGTIPEQTTVSLADLWQTARMPTVFPSSDGGVRAVVTTAHYPCLKWAYAIELRVGSHAEGRMPMLVAAVPPDADDVQQFQGKPAIQGLVDPLDIFQLTTWDDEAATEDGGGTVVAAGPPCEVTSDEDGYVVRQDKDEPYQPRINTFPGTAAAAKQS